MSDLDQYLTELGWRKSDLARRLGVHRNTVQLWRKDLPKYARAYLSAMLALSRALRG